MFESSFRLCTATMASRLHSIGSPLQHSYELGLRMLYSMQQQHAHTRICSLLLRRPSDIFHLCAPLFRPMRFACSHPTDRRERGQNVAWKWSHMKLGAAVWANLGTRGRHCSVMRLRETPVTNRDRLSY
jgi:hypothetical protein